MIVHDGFIQYSKLQVYKGLTGYNMSIKVKYATTMMLTWLDILRYTYILRYFKCKNFEKWMEIVILKSKCKTGTENQYKLSESSSCATSCMWIRLCQGLTAGTFTTKYLLIASDMYQMWYGLVICTANFLVLSPNFYVAL